MSLDEFDLVSPGTIKIEIVIVEKIALNGYNWSFLR